MKNVSKSKVLNKRLVLLKEQVELKKELKRAIKKNSLVKEDENILGKIKDVSISGVANEENFELDESGLQTEPKDIDGLFDAGYKYEKDFYYMFPEFEELGLDFEGEMPIGVYGDIEDAGYVSSDDESFKRDNSYNWSWMMGTDMEYVSFEYNGYYIVFYAPHLGGDIRGNYGDTKIAVFDDEYGITEALFSIYAFVTITMEDGSEYTLDGSGDRGIWSLENDEYESDTQSEELYNYVNENFQENSFEKDEFFFNLEK